jgi:Trk-type K+ transport system membrane component
MGSLVISRVVSGVVLALGLALFVPLALSLLYRDGSWLSFLLPAAAFVLMGGVGLQLTISLVRTPRYVSNRDVYLSVTLAWVVAALLGGVPFLIEGTFDSLLDSTFEAMSGFTTTGSTLLSDIEAQTPSILFWRSMTQWLGGIGIVVLFVAVAPVIGAGAARLLGAEVSGLTQTRLTPRIATAAKLTLVLLMFVGGCAGSTAGGIKVIRVLVIFRTLLQDIFRMVHPRAVTPLVVGGRMVPEGIRLAVLGLFAAWIAIFGAASLLVALQDNLTLTSSATAVAATLNVIGPGLGQVGATESFEIIDPFGRVVLTVCMLLGRLELFTALALLSPAFWKR